jgi:uncharacterized protein YebE (UPF0316 family)
MAVLRPLVIASLVLTEVGIWQWRMVIAHRGNRVMAMLLGVLGAVLQITAITQVVAGVHDPLSIVGYAAGVGLGCSSVWSPVNVSRPAWSVSP